MIDRKENREDRRGKDREENREKGIKECSEECREGSSEENREGDKEESREEGQKQGRPESRQKMPVTVALAGNPNVGKTTIFNGLTGMRQHTGNWPGKTVAQARGTFSMGNQDYLLVDLPGTYSLAAHSEEEEIARDYLCSGEAQMILVVCDGTCLERGLHLLCQILALSPVRDAGTPLILCVNLCDEAAKKGILIDFPLLRDVLQIPVLSCCAHHSVSLQQIRQAIADARGQQFNYHCLDFSPGELARETVRYTRPNYRKREEIIDRIVTGPITGGLIMLLLLLGVFWLTLTGANLPSSLLWDGLFWLEARLAEGMAALGAPSWLIQMLVYGVYRVLAWVVSVMLPPMAIFFPLFTLLEDLGYLPRIAFNMDGAFRRCHACGKQCLTTVMGFGCNAAGVVGCRIIDSPRERLIAILTNALVPCNGRLPTLFLMITLLFLGNQAVGEPVVAEQIVTEQVVTEQAIAEQTAAEQATAGRAIAEQVEEQAMAEQVAEQTIAERVVGSRTVLTSWPALSEHLSPEAVSFLSALLLTLVILLGIGATLAASWLLSHTLLKGLPSAFTLELPPYRRPQVGKVIVRSIFDRTLFVLARAVAVAAPAGLLIWILANVSYVTPNAAAAGIAAASSVTGAGLTGIAGAGGVLESGLAGIGIPGIGRLVFASPSAPSLLSVITGFLEPLGHLMGLDGVILTAFLLGFPANEIVVPIALMAYLQTGTLTEMTDPSALLNLLTAHGWNHVTMICMMLFCLFHWPCSTTVLTIHKETGSWKWTAVAVLLPTLLGMALCILTAALLRTPGLFQ